MIEGENIGRSGNQDIQILNIKIFLISQYPIILNFMTKFIKYLSLSVLFLLPFQTRLIYDPVFLNGYYFEWFSQSLLGVEILVWLTVLLTFLRLVFNKTFWREINEAKDKKDRVMKIIRPILFLACLLIYWRIIPLDRGLAEYKIFLLLGVGCFALTLLINKIPFKNIFYALWGGGVLQAMFGIFQFIFQHTWANKWLGLAVHYPSDLGAAVLQIADGGRWMRAYGAFGWPNDLGIYLSIVFLLGLIVYFKVQNEKEKIIILAGQMFLIAGLFFSFSRGALLALLLGILVLYFQKKRSIFPVLLWPTVLFVILSIIYLPLLQSRVAAQNYLEIRAINERLSQYQDFANVFSTNPLFGVGPGNYIYALFAQNSNLVPWLYQPVHNVYLLFLAEWGIFGSILALILIGYLFRQIWRYNKQILPIWAFFTVVFLFDHYFYTAYSGLVIFAVLVVLSVKYGDLTN